MNKEYNLERFTKAQKHSYETAESSDPERVMGFPDNLKLQSCMTLFAEVAPDEEVFQKVLDKYFDGEKDRHTLQILGTHT
ncbi:MAG: DUF1810 domain-containing protein [Lachnospiraceae bacterium]|nr:DUF1810 domain-containing protein [Lachnospiraceae bacterium]